MSQRIFPIAKGQLLGDLDANEHKVENLAEPVDDSDAATKKYVDDNAGGSPTWDDIRDKPTAFPPSAHTHPQSQVEGLVGDLAAKLPASAKLSDLHDELGTPTADNRLELLGTGKLKSKTKVQTGWGTIHLDHLSDGFEAYDSSGEPYLSTPPLGEWKGPFGPFSLSFTYYVPASEPDPTSDDEATRGKWCIISAGYGWNLMYSQSAYAVIPSIESAEFTNDSASGPAPYAIVGHAYFTREPVTEMQTRQFAETTDIPALAAPSESATDAQAAKAKSTYDFVNSSINAMAAFYITKDAAGDSFATKAELSAAIASGTFYNGGELRTPTKNDYLYVLADESVTPIIPGVAPTTRYSFDGAQWAFQIIVNNTALTSAQVAAINSGINAALVSWLSTFKGSDTSTTLASVLAELAGKRDYNDRTFPGGEELALSSEVPSVVPYNAASGSSGAAEADSFRGEIEGKADIQDFSPSAPAQYVADFVQKCVRYQTHAIGSDGVVANFAFNTLSMSGNRTLTFPTVAAGDPPRVFLLVVTYTSGSLTLPSGFTYYGDAVSMDANATYLFAFTEVKSGEFYRRVIKMEVPNA